jgi:hypothetical protein
VPVDPFDQHCELRWRECDCPAWVDHARPGKTTGVDPFGEQAEPVAIPEQDLEHRSASPAEGEEMT